MYLRGKQNDGEDSPESGTIEVRTHRDIQDD